MFLQMVQFRMVEKVVIVEDEVVQSVAGVVVNEENSVALIGTMAVADYCTMSTITIP